MPDRGALHRVWRPAWPCPVAAILSGFRRGPGDPTYRVDSDGTLWRGVRTPQGTATLRLPSGPRGGEVRATAWGPGREWVLDQLPALLGARDDPAGFAPRHRALQAAHRRYRHWRVARSGLVMEALVPAILEQKVTGQEAFASFRRLVRRYGERAPGLGAERDLWVQPAPRTLTGIASWDWLHLQVDSARSQTLVRAAAVAASLERTLALPGPEVERRLCTLPGIGVWTAAEVRFRAHGDADAVSFGDCHVAKDVGWALTGREVDDAGLADLLAPYRPHRYRVQRLVELAGYSRPRRGPRSAPRRHLPVRARGSAPGTTRTETPPSPPWLTGTGAVGPARPR